jgi:hypothetical protein
MAARPPFPACGGLIGHAPPNYHVHVALPCRHAPVPHEPHGSSPAPSAQRPAPEHSPSPRPPSLTASLSIVVHPSLQHGHPRRSRTLPVSSRAAVSPPAIGPAAVLFASQARNVSVPSCALAFMPGPRPASRDRLRLPHTIVTRCAHHAAPSPLCPQTQNTTKHSLSLLDSHHSYTTTPTNHRSPAGPAHGPLLTYRMTHAAPSSLVLHAPCSLCHAVMQPQPRDHHHDADPRQPGFLRARATLSPVHSLSAYSLADPPVPSPTPLAHPPTLCSALLCSALLCNSGPPEISTAILCTTTTTTPPPAPATVSMPAPPSHKACVSPVYI